MKDKVYRRFIEFLNDLERSKIYYTLAHHREEAIMVLIAVPGERWEVEFMSDGSVEVERFVSSGEICGEEALTELFDTHSDPEERVIVASPDVELAAADG